MLERISNISLEANLNKSKKRRYSHSRGGVYEHSSFDVSDSISFSPASKYLSKVNWLLKDFNQSAEDKIIVEFIYGGFHFEVSVDLQSIDTITYVIRKNDSIIPDINSVLATFKVSVGNSDDSPPFQKELRGLEQLFQRFSSLNLKSELNIYNYELIDTLLEGYYYTLQKDFEYLNNVLFKFIEKQTGKRINKNKKLEIELNILKIKPYKRT